MNLLKRIFDFYINASIHVALAICALVGVTVLEFDLDQTLAFWGFVFFGSITGYNFVKYARVAGLHHHSLTDALQVIQMFSFVCFGILLYCSYFLSMKTLLVTAVFGLLTFFYAVPFLKYKNLRSLSGLKIFIVALVWAGFTVVVPIVANAEAISTDGWISFGQRIFMVLVLTLPFEIRDLKYDGVVLKTLPQQLGLRATKFLGIFLLVLVFLAELFKDDISESQLLILFGVCVVISIGLYISKKKQAPYFASFCIESIPILWYALLCFSEKLL